MRAFLEECSRVLPFSSHQTYLSGSFPVFCRAAVLSLFGIRSGLCRRQCFHGPGEGECIRTIQVHYINCAFYFCYYHISSSSDHQALDPWGWRPLLQNEYDGDSHQRARTQDLSLPFAISLMWRKLLSLSGPQFSSFGCWRCSGWDGLGHSLPSWQCPMEVQRISA